ncbi:MAG: hypothetical protein JOZ69_10470 [Myxococcales bacterium]|nr:hypothetical protein [Myxococcales bacterium]
MYDLGEMRGMSTLVPNVREVATLLGHPERGERFAASLSARMSRVAADLPGGGRKRGLYLGVYGGRLYGASSGTSHHDVLIAAGLEEAADRFRDWPAYSVEQVLAMSIAVARSTMAASAVAASAVPASDKAADPSDARACAAPASAPPPSAPEHAAASSDISTRPTVTSEEPLTVAHVLTRFTHVNEAGEILPPVRTRPPRPLTSRPGCPSDYARAAPPRVASRAAWTRASAVKGFTSSGTRGGMAASRARVR